MMYYNTDHMNGWGYGFMTVGTLLFWGLLIFAVYTLFRYFGSDPGRSSAPAAPPSAPSASAEQILAERFARDEIDAEEYRQRLDTLRGVTGNTTNGKVPSDRPPITTT